MAIVLTLGCNNIIFANTVNHKFYKDGRKEINFSVTPYQKDQIVYIPLREFFNIRHCDVMYKAPYAIIRIPNTSGDRIIKIVPGTNSIEVSGTNSVLIHSTEVINGTTYISTDDIFILDSSKEQHCDYELTSDGTMNIYFRHTSMSTKQHKWIYKNYDDFLNKIFCYNLVLFEPKDFHFMWQYPFMTENTYVNEFTRTDGTKEKQEFLMTDSLFDYYEEESTKAVSLPLKNKQYEMLFVSTNEISSDLLNRIQKYKDTRSICVHIPKISLETNDYALYINEKGVSSRNTIDETTEYIDILGYSYTPELIFDTPFYYFLIDTTNDSILCGGYYE